jgi:hypothetical protein
MQKRSVSERRCRNLHTSSEQVPHGRKPHATVDVSPVRGSKPGLDFAYPIPAWHPPQACNVTLLAFGRLGSAFDDGGL